MKIAAFTEGGYTGLVPRNHPNMRTDLAWWCALEAVHHPLEHLPSMEENMYDLGIIIIPKKRRHLMQVDLIGELKRVCKKVATMQESTYYYWQDDPIDEQIWYYNLIMEMDLILCHNEPDLKYYRGITDKRCEIMRTLMIEDNIKPHILNHDARDSVMIGGNFVSAYGGFDSYIVGREMSDKIFAPTTGRMKEEERGMDITHLDWVSWSSWINNLSRFKYGVQLGTAAAGTFNLNCAYHGIPCIGYSNVDTQRICHSKLTVDVGDIKSARKLAVKLKEDEDFYKECSQIAMRKYKECFDEEVYIYTMKKVIEEVIST